MKSQVASNTTAIQHVFVTVAGGVAYVVETPETTEVHIIDFDDLKDDFEFAFSRLTAREQAFYWRMEQATTGLAGHESL